jgi:hypothetical protein
VVVLELFFFIGKFLAASNADMGVTSFVSSPRVSIRIGHYSQGKYQGIPRAEM